MGKEPIPCKSVAYGVGTLAWSEKSGREAVKQGFILAAATTDVGET